uniref:Uncharacterized protein n=1 Tax=Utricularia reniformis TaxID=192314 RepID=A0A1Y0B267_9LAMI|nr:hypothetical protein AEK19_MT1279 [Utricularia reniformis]ART31484.1 hypothetical protein AEK19_MT1279 [Utricularia reniformis]
MEFRFATGLNKVVSRVEVSTSKTIEYLSRKEDNCQLNNNHSTQLHITLRNDTFMISLVSLP